MEACSTSRRLLVSTLVLLVLGSLIKDVGAGRASPLRIPGIFSSQSGVSVPRKAPNTTLTSVGFFHTFRKPPWGGGNQFLMALAGEMRARGITVLDNKIEADKTKVYMANAITFKTDPFKAAMKKSKNKLKLVHRLDGPYYAARYEKDPRTHAHEKLRYKEDDKVYEINNQFACASIYQSKWSLDMNLLLGYKPKEPVTIIPNAVDANIFHSEDRRPWDPNRKTKIISTSWSDGLRKGFKHFEWLDKNLDFDRFEYTFLGNLPKDKTTGKVLFSFKNIKVLPPVGSEKLAPILRDHDIYIAASALEPCSNALLEALSSGLPTIYLKGSGHDELVKEAGIGYTTPDEIPAHLDEMVSQYEDYQSKIHVLTIEEVTDKYLQVYEHCLRQI